MKLYIYITNYSSYVIRLNPYPNNCQFFQQEMKKIHPPFIFDFALPMLNF